MFYYFRQLKGERVKSMDCEEDIDDDMGIEYVNYTSTNDINEGKRKVQMVELDESDESDSDSDSDFL